MQYNSPDFLILGAQKAGTTALYAYLRFHPQVISARTKEVSFFSKDYSFAKGPVEYSKYFNATSPEVKSYEATPEYLYYPFVAERIFSFKPDIKLIVLLRDPVKRAFSAWNMFREWFHLPGDKASIFNYHLRNLNQEYKSAYSDLMFAADFPDFHTCVLCEIEQLKNGVAETEPGFVARGLYHRQITRYLKYFSRDQMLFIDNKKLQSDTVNILNQVCRFLDIQDVEWPAEIFTPVHDKTYNKKMEQKSIYLLKDFYAEENRKMEELVGENFDWS